VKRYDEAVKRYRQAVSDRTLDPKMTPELAIENGMIDPQRMTPALYALAIEKGMIAPGHMTPGDMADMAISDMKEHLPEIRQEFQTDRLMRYYRGKDSLFDPSKLQAEIDTDLEALEKLFHNPAATPPFKESGRQKFIADLNSMLVGLQGFSQKQNQVLAAYAQVQQDQVLAAAYARRHPGAPPKLVKVPDEDINALKTKVQEALKTLRSSRYS
jgi:hypothetical protein